MRTTAFRVAALVTLGGLFLAGCGAGRTMVMEPPAAKKAFPAATLVRLEDNVTVPAEYGELLVKEIREGLYGTADKPGAFREGEGLSVRVKVVQFDAGSKFQRWFWGGIGNQGEASLHTVAEFYDGETRLAQIQTEGRIGSGAFGGSMKSAVEKAALEISEYAAANFR